MKNQIREPQQERSIEKKNKIIQAGYELFSEVGYYGTNTVEIAKRAGVSTGIVYGYFQDKRDIMISVLQKYVDNAYLPVLEVMKGVDASLEIENIVPKIIDKTLETHEKNAKLHNTLHSLAATDETVNAKFIALEDNITENISEQLKKRGLTLSNVKERVHLAMNIVQSFAHEYVFDKHPYIDYGAMRETVCTTVINLFK